MPTCHLSHNLDGRKPQKHGGRISPRFHFSDQLLHKRDRGLLEILIGEAYRFRCFDPEFTMICLISFNERESLISKNEE